MGAERDVVGKPLSIIFGKSWSTGEIPDDLRKDSVTHMFKKTDDSGKPWPVRLTSTIGNVEQIILEVITKDVKESHKK